MIMDNKEDLKYENNYWYLYFEELENAIIEELLENQMEVNVNE